MALQVHRAFRGETVRNICWLGIVLTVAASGQQDIPSFRTGTTLIEFTVVALDGKGNPVTDLKKEEIEVADQGRRREVAFFRFEGASETREVAPLAPGEFTNRAEYTTGPPRNITAIVIDTLNTRLEDQIQLRSQVLECLREIPPDARIGIYWLGWGSLRILHDFTDDVDSLRATLSGNAVEAPMRFNINVPLSAETESAMLDPGSLTEGGATLSEAFGTTLVMEKMNVEMQTNVVNQTLASLEWIGNHVAGIPGRKSIVWISGGIPNLAGSDGWVTSYEDDIRELAQRLASQGITMYPADATGLSGQVDVSQQPTRVRSPTGRLLGFRSPSVFRGRYWATMDIMASTTGGRTTRSSNHLTRGIEQAAADLHGSYTVGYYTDDEPDDKWHRLKVKILRKGVKLTHRKGYLLSVPSEQPQTWSAKEWVLPIVNPLGSTEIHLDARCEPADGDGTYNLILQIAADDLEFVEVAERLEADIDIAVAEKTAVGGFGFQVYSAGVQLTGDQEAPAAGTLARGTLRFQLKPDTITMRVIVRDRYTGRSGTLDLPVNRLPGQAQ